MHTETLYVVFSNWQPGCSSFHHVLQSYLTQLQNCKFIMVITTLSVMHHLILSNSDLQEPHKHSKSLQDYDIDDGVQLTLTKAVNELPALVTDLLQGTRY